MTRLGQMIMEDGIQKGIQEECKQLNALNVKLLLENRIEDCLKAATDQEYQEQLMKEFGIK